MSKQKDSDNPPANALRQRPPSLFLGPPSRNVSNISLQPPAAYAPRDPLLRTRSARGPPNEQSHRESQQRPPLPPSASADASRTDALWAEMQATLAEVEMSALNSNGIFGQAHEAALEELRVAQMELAKGWGRMGGAEEEGRENGDSKERGPKADSKEKGRAKDSGQKEGKDDDEDDDAEEKEEMEAARRRREENDKFFAKVQEGVEDVVGKLEKVAEAMGKVERESRDIWGSETSGSVTS